MSRISVLCLICICPSSYISSLHSYCLLSCPGLETWGHAWLLSFSPHLVHYQVLWIPSPKSLSSPFSPHSLSLPLGCHHFLSGALMESSSPLSQCTSQPQCTCSSHPHLLRREPGHPGRKCMFSLEGNGYLLCLFIYFSYIFIIHVQNKNLLHTCCVPGTSRGWDRALTE